MVGEIKLSLQDLRANAQRNSALGGNWQHINEHHGRLWITVRVTAFTIESWYRGRLQGSLANLITH